MPCGLWSGPRSDAETFADVILSCFGEMPSHPLLRADYENVIANLQKITCKGRTVSGDENVVFKMDDRNPSNVRVKFQHKLFDNMNAPVRSPPFFKGTVHCCVCVSCTLD
jgi:hypothetical protein